MLAIITLEREADKVDVAPMLQGFSSDSGPSWCCYQRIEAVQQSWGHSSSIEQESYTSCYSGNYLYSARFLDEQTCGRIYGMGDLKQ